MTSELPEVVFERLIFEASDSRRRRSLEAINEACKIAASLEVKDFSYRALLAMGQARGLAVPSEKSIVNPTGEHYRLLIHAWKQASMPAPTHQFSDALSWVLSIEDPVLKLNVSLLVKELKALKSKMRRQLSSGMTPIFLGAVEGKTPETYFRLREVEISALRFAIDEDNLRQMGQIIGPRGEVSDSKGRIIQKPGFRDAIEKVLTLEREE